MEHLDFTLNLAAGTRRETLDGREYIIAPLSMIVSGVLNGSNGPLYYPADELARNVDAWNGMPLVVNHPTRNGKPVSARTPEIMQASRIGWVFNAKFADGRLSGEGWFDAEKTKQVDSRIWNALNVGQQIELSTGLFTDNEPVEGESATHNGTVYQFIARNYRPDHLAILPDLVGACSVKAGCGVNVNAAAPGLLQRLTTAINNALTVALTPPEFQPALTANEEAPVMSDAKKTLVDTLISNCECWEESDRETLNAFSEDKLQKLQPKKDGNQTVNQVDAAMKKGGEGLIANSEPAKPAAPAKPKTAAEWLAEAPPEIRSAVQNAQRVEAAEKAAIVAKLTANLSDEQKPAVAAVLNAKPLDELRTLELLAPAAPVTPTQPDYLGSVGGGAPTRNATANAPKSQPLIPPTINWAEQAG